MVEEIIFDTRIWLTVALWFAMALAAIAVYHSLREGSRQWEEEIRRVKQSYEERIDSYKKEIESLKELLETREKVHREEIEKLARINRMLHELHNAVEKGAVRLTCPRHIDTGVTLFIDGTIICDKGHRLWPLETGAAETVETTQITQISSPPQQSQQLQETEKPIITQEQFEKLARSLGIRADATKLRGLYKAVFKEPKEHEGEEAREKTEH